MLLAILCPEFIFAWAVQQWFSARKLRDIYNSINPGMLGILISDIQNLPRHDVELPWTMAYFLMASPLSSALPTDPCMSSQTSNLFSPYITKEYLKDRFQSTDTITALQIFWFYFQACARSSQGNPLTRLEVLAVPELAMIFCARAFWLCKPLDVWQPIRVEVNADLDSHSMHQGPLDTNSEQATRDRSLFPSDAFACTCKIIKDITNGFPMDYINMVPLSPFMAY